MADISDFRVNHSLANPFTTTGKIGDVVTVSSRTLGHIVVEGVAAGNIIEIRGRIREGPDEIVATITGPTIGFIFDTFKFDEIEFVCTTFVAAGSSTLKYAFFVFNPITREAQAALDGLFDNINVEPLRASAQVTGSVSFKVVADITLKTATSYRNLEWIVACFRDANFEIVHIDDLGGSPTETILGFIKVGSGAFTNEGSKRSQFTTGATGTQVLRVRGANLNSVSDLAGALCIAEILTT